LKKYIQVTKTTYFYELYLVNTTDIDTPDDQLGYEDIPIAIMNYRAADGSFPNQDFSKSSSLRYVKRFFLIDVVSGITQTGGYELQDSPDVIFTLCMLIFKRSSSTPKQ